MTWYTDVPRSRGPQFLGGGDRLPDNELVPSQPGRVDGDAAVDPVLAARRPASPESGQLASARNAFLTDDGVDPGVVRPPILASWTRSRQWDVDSGHLELPYESETYRESLLLRVAKPILEEVADQLATEPMSVILCDDDGVVLQRRTGDSTLDRHLDSIWLAPGFSYAERYVGTNGIGTALEGRGPAQVFGHEHFVENLEDLACAGEPIRHPVSGKLMGVLDLTCWRRDSSAMMMAVASSVARRVEETMLRQSGRRELALLHDYLTACHRNRGAVLAVSDDLLMMNDQARELLDPGDQTPLLAEATEALNSGRRHQLVIDLPSGATARVQCRPTWSDGGVKGGVLQVQVLATDPAPRRGHGMASPAALPAAVGSGALWVKCCQAVDRHFGSREWLVLEGEAGSGKATLARATHQMRTPAAHLRLLDARDVSTDWLAEVSAELEGDGGTLVITHIDQLDTVGVRALAERLEPLRESPEVERPWVVATMDRGRAGGLAELLDCFPRTVEVPPLRHHVEDVAELVPYFIARLTRGADLRCSREAMRVLMRNRWPGNAEQLYQVLRKIVAKRRTGVIEVRDLPAETRASTRRVLTPLEAIECDAIVDALLDTDGNKAEAARLLGMSRATIYRKVRGYGISMPGPGEAR